MQDIRKRHLFRSVLGSAVLAAMPWFLCIWENPNATAGTLDAPVVGGREARPGEWPDVVAVLMQNNTLCSGTLIGADLVLTAAHCVEGVPEQVIVGAVDLAAPGGQRRAVKWSKAYPSWMGSYDVGVVMLENPVFVKPRAIVERCSATSFAAGTKVALVGFGQTTTTATDSNTKLHVATLAIDDPTCTADPSCQAAVAPGGEFVAGGDGTDACFGDSGGPVYLPTAKGPALIGVVSRGLASFGRPCGEGGVFVRADAVVSWIERVTGRKIVRSACEAPADSADDPTDGGGDSDGDGDGAGGCDAGGAGALEGGLGAYYALLCAWGLRRGRRGRRATTRRTWPRSR